ncbi:unnamed protein product, partial [marine sediment metagenome]
RSGVFIKALMEELSKRKLKIPLRGIRDSAPATLEEDLDWLEETLART